MVTALGLFCTIIMLMYYGSEPNNKGTCTKILKGVVKYYMFGLSGISVWAAGDMVYQIDKSISPASLDSLLQCLTLWKLVDREHVEKK